MDVIAGSVALVTVALAVVLAGVTVVVGIQLMRGRWLRLITGAWSLPKERLESEEMRQVGQGVGIALVALVAISLVVYGILATQA